MHTVRRTPAGTAQRKNPDNKKGFAYCFQVGNLIQRCRRKPSKKANEEKTAGAETVPQLVERIREYIRHVEEEEEEVHTQKDYEKQSKKPHWKKVKNKPGPKNKEEDEELKKRFPDGQVSCASNYDECVLMLLFSVSAVSKKGQAG